MTPMTGQALFLNAFPYQKDLLSLPVVDLDKASAFYAGGFGMIEAERRNAPHPTVILERDGVRIGFATNGADASSYHVYFTYHEAIRVHRLQPSHGPQP